MSPYDHKNFVFRICSYSMITAQTPTLNLIIILMISIWSFFLGVFFSIWFIYLFYTLVKFHVHVLYSKYTRIICTYCLPTKYFCFIYEENEYQTSVADLEVCPGGASRSPLVEHVLIKQVIVLPFWVFNPPIPSGQKMYSLGLQLHLLDWICPWRLLTGNWVDHCLPNGDHASLLFVVCHQFHHLLHVCFPLEWLHVNHKNRLTDAVIHLLIQWMHPAIQNHAQPVYIILNSPRDQILCHAFHFSPHLILFTWNLVFLCCFLCIHCSLS